jgi:hypothetical protein
MFLNQNVVTNLTKTIEIMLMQYHQIALEPHITEDIPFYLKIQFVHFTK